MPRALTAANVQDHLGVVLPAILDGLADESEGVRDAALQAGRTAVELFAQTSLPLLLPAVENGIIHDNWRIRQSSVELLGDLLFKVSMQRASSLFVTYHGAVIIGRKYSDVLLLSTGGRDIRKDSDGWRER